MTKKEQQQIYEPPQVMAEEIKTRKVLCQSGGINKMERDADDSELFN